MRTVLTLMTVGICMNASARNDGDTIVKKPVFYAPGSYYADVLIQVATKYGVNRTDIDRPLESGFTPALGLSYCYGRNKLVSVWGGFTLGNKPFPVLHKRWDYPDTTQRISTVFANVTNNHILLKFFSVGYGVGFSHHMHQRFVKDDSLTDKRTIVNYKSSGITVPLTFNYLIYRLINLGVVYQPQLYSFQRGFQYEYTVSFNVILRIKNPAKDRR